MSAKSWILAGAALLTLAAPTSAATFTTAIGTPVGGPEGNCSGGGLGVTQASASIAVTGQCASPGQLNGSAAALFGHVGAGSSVAGFPGYFGSGFAMSASAEFRDIVTFSPIDPGDPSFSPFSIISVATNLQFSGVLAADDAGAAAVGLFLQMAGFYALDAATNTGVTRNSFQIIDGSVSAGTSNAHLRTGFGQIFLGEPQPLVMRISTIAAASGDGSARADFSNSLAIPFGMDVFVLPPGITANAGTWLVNNRRVGGPVGAVPEPSTWAMMILGFGIVGFSLRQRRKQTLAPA